MAILRRGRVIVPQSDDPLEVGDEMLFIAPEELEHRISELVHDPPGLD